MEPEGKCEKGTGFTSLLTKEYMRRVRVVTTTLSVAFPAHRKPSTVVWSSWKISREERAFLVLRGVTPCLGRGGENGGVGALWIILKVLHLWRNAGKIGKR